MPSVIDNDDKNEQRTDVSDQKQYTKTFEVRDFSFSA